MNLEITDMLQETKNLRIVTHLNKSSFIKDKITIKFASTYDAFFEAIWLISREYVLKGLIKSERKLPYFSPYLIIMPNNRLLIVLHVDQIIDCYYELLTMGRTFGFTPYRLHSVFMSQYFMSDTIHGKLTEQIKKSSTPTISYYQGITNNESY
ncbi:hypothetical protein A9G41_00385 [Gilliamella sp. Nev5-1]|nr:hypothetical protein A9G40_03495 [Gilliamella apicola]OCG70335.1 hypothetical protein A9G41_00385 [Gilliamella apicola]